MKTTQKLNVLLAISILFFSMCNTVENKSKDSISSFRCTIDKSDVKNIDKISEPKIKWKCNLNGTSLSSPAISEGVVYVGSGDNNLYAVELQSGEINWKFATKGAIQSTPAIYNSTILFTSMDGSFYAIDKNSGKEKWTFKTGGEKQYAAVNLFGFDTKGIEGADPWDFYLSSPIVKDDVIYFGSGDSHIYALDVNSGALVWTYKTGNVVHSSPAIENGIVYCGSFDGNLYALDAKTGDEKWVFEGGKDEKYKLMVGIQASPTVQDNIVYFGSRDAYVYAVEAKSGKLKWKKKFGNSWMPSSVAVSGNKLFVGSSDARKFFTVSKADGNIVDSLITKSFTFSSPTVAGNKVLVGSFNGFLWAVDKDSGTTSWKFRTEASKAHVDKYFTEEGDEMKELNEGITYKQHTDMNLFLERVYKAGAIASSPVVAAGNIYFTSTDGYLYALN